MGERLLVIGNKNLSSWSLRPWLLMRHTGIEFRERLMRFEDEAFRDAIGALSPSRLVPVLHDGEIVVWDSLAIAEHLAESFPEKTLWPRDRSARAEARAVSAEMHAGFGALRRELSLDVTARHPRAPFSAEVTRDVRRIQAIWAGLRAKHGGPFLFGAFSIADAMYAPVVFRFRTYDVPLEDEVRPWVETMLALPALQEWERAAEAEVLALASRPETGAPSPRAARAQYAVIFSSQRRSGPAPLPGTPGTSPAPETDDYEATAARMVDLAARQPGFVGIESVRAADGAGITVSYWESTAAIAAWKSVAEHEAAQAAGRSRYYERYQVRVCAVERGYAFP